ncbi:metallophosphoesterase [Pseudarthrobacter chlorophenolicus A6]|uniref:Metallophosphoesterase n=1 Tax=Pseudarthrobacter chlorophenolicus (strain ATCC 700700 / DSM 12829 / CIP 107037 / JCM 12360 / KCTC 9906 / NCIMB 13794 / A6) TaxID=452863 RepID=B8HBY5_PSECP|nr:phosphodiesterase [Pseudarthrobacter chlorophenolicus]ACL38695.1 metallophosphoesterase [Pseudarthrobacter chlorophenolicus A6]SDQ43525.1 3',5'-cyclic AMP phosphodiesterase CpdA [Pseudarthrobacter chlorophenolicus]
MEHIEAEHPRPRHFLLHLSDPHLLGGPEPLYGVVDSEARLAQLFEEVKASGARPEAVIFTGDLADRGEPGAYAKLRAIVDPACKELGAEVIWAMGNHDNRANFREGLLDQPRDDAPVDNSYFINGLRVITMDTTVPGYHHGELCGSQLEWLARELETPAPDGTILALHHPPVPSVLDLSVLVELRDQGSLAAVVRNSDVRTILAGHLHYSTTATFAGIPVSVASASCYTQDLNVPVGGTRGQDGGQAFNLVHVYEHTIVHSVVPMGTATTVGEYVTAEETARRLEAAGVRIPETAKQRTTSRTGATTGR